VESALTHNAEDVFARLLGDGAAGRSGGGDEALRRLSRLIGAQDNQDAVGQWLHAVASTVRPAETIEAEKGAVPGSKGLQWERAAELLRELARGLRQSGVELRRTLVVAGGDDALLLDGVLEQARARAVDATADLGARQRAIRTLALSTYGRENEVLTGLLGSHEPPEVQLATLEAVSAFQGVRVAEALIEQWRGWTPKVRSRALEVILERPERVTVLLDAIDGGAVLPGELAPAQRRDLRRYANGDVAKRARQVLPEVPSARREEVVAAYRSSLTTPGDAERGAALFAKNCASCHEFRGVGYALGPNISNSHERGLEGLLQNILDPNREVDPQYLNYEVVVTDGRVLSGLVSAESAGAVTLERGAGLRETVSRTELVSLRSSGVSLMPEGLEAEISPVAMADLLAYLAAIAGEVNTVGGGWQAGVSKRNITPLEPMWLSGYGSRDHPSTGKLTDLWAKALYMQDGQGRAAVLVTLDLVGLDRELSLAVRRQICEQHGLELADVALATSHTHTGPVVGDNLKAMYFFDAEERTRVVSYAERLGGLIVAVVAEARANVAPTRLEWGTGKATFAVNRRENREADIPELRASGRLKGPVDHDVPVLRVATATGRLLAVVFGYACHCTVLDTYEWSGDYAGFAQAELEKSHPSALALFWAGCGADQNPLPRRSVSLALQYGRNLASAVDEVLSGDLRPILGRLRTAYDEIDLPFGTLPTTEEIAEQIGSENRYLSSRARLLQAKIENDGALSPTYPYPIQSWQLGSRLRFVLLGGEVVVDYALRLKQELGPLWVAGYSNDVMAYIPSRRVLAEGGYEGATSMIYYGQPTSWAAELEDMIVNKVKEQLTPVAVDTAVSK
jgi:neutral ceramidase